MPVKSDVFLRRADREDLDTVIEWMEDPDFQYFMYGDPTRSPKQVREQIVALLGRTVGHTMPGGIYLIIDSKASGPIGLVSLQNISWRNRSCSIDMYLGKKDLRNSFLAGLSFFRLMEYCFDELNLHKVNAFVYSFNSRSWRLVERSGAVRELTLREHVARDGKLYDMYCYGMLRKEFEKLRAETSSLSGKSLAEMVEGLRETDSEASP